MRIVPVRIFFVHMIRMYSFRQFITSEAASGPHYLVIGHPVSHSLSPSMHRVALKHHHMEADYHAIDLEMKDFSSFVSWINRDTFLGANITIPYKQQMMDVADILHETAEAVGALNTLVKKNGVITGYNTDVSGFLSPLEKYRSKTEGGQVIVFGTGGAAKAVIHALGILGVERVIIVSRSPDSQYLEGGGAEIICCGYDNWQAFSDETVMLVNTTPLGMSTLKDQSPVSQADVSLLNGKICYDLVYNPLETVFLRQAQVAGGIPVGGLDMFIQQGNESFRLWTGKHFPLDKIETLLKAQLNSHKSD